MRYYVTWYDKEYEETGMGCHLSSSYIFKIVRKSGFYMTYIYNNKEINSTDEEKELVPLSLGLLINRFDSFLNYSTDYDIAERINDFFETIIKDLTND